MHTFTLLPLGDGITEATVNLWLKDVGDEVTADEPLVEISTDKVDTELVAPVSGTLTERHAAEGDTVAVGAALGVIVPSGAPAADDRAPAEPVTAPSVQVTAVTSVEASVPVPEVPLAPPEVTPSAGDPRRGTTERLSRVRRTIANRMMDSLHGSAQLTTVIEVDVTAVAELRRDHQQAFREREGLGLSFLPFFARAALDALREHAVVNATLDMEAGVVTYPPHEHLGVAVDTERGLIVPVIRDAGDLSIAALARSIADVASRTRDGSIGVDELGGGTFTLTNTGSRGALFDTPILNAPQSAILGTGAVVDRPVVVRSDHGKAIAIRSMVYLALSYDHRVVDGADAARFLQTMRSRLEEAAFDVG